jgi:proteasome assembly chaperone (PAC2) family protein
MKEKFNIGADYKGPFYGFSGLVFGLAKLKGLKAVCLFASAEPNPEDPELPAAESSKMILATLRQMLGFHIKPPSL